MFHSGEEVSVITAGQVESDAFQQHQVLGGQSNYQTILAAAELVV
jgi:hypothetical protein